MNDGLPDLPPIEVQFESGSSGIIAAVVLEGKWGIERLFHQRGPIGLASGLLDPQPGTVPTRETSPLLFRAGPGATSLSCANLKYHEDGTPRLLWHPPGTTGICPN